MVIIIIQKVNILNELTKTKPHNMEIIKIDNDTFQIKTETVEEVSLSQLEQELARKQNYNEEIKPLHTEVLKLPESLRQYVILPLYEDTTKEEELIKLLKENNV